MGLGWTENPIYKQIFVRMENVSYNIPTSFQTGMQNDRGIPITFFDVKQFFELT